VRTVPFGKTPVRSWVVLHLAWDHGSLAVVGWHDRALPIDSVQSLATRLFGRDLTPMTRSIMLPGKREASLLHGMTVPVAAAAEAFGVQAWVPWKSLSPSLGWGQAAATLASDLVEQGSVVPGLDAVSGQTWWRPMIDDVTAQSLVKLTEAMPPIFGALHPEAAPWQLTLRLVTSLADDAARVTLFGAPAGGPPSRDRRPVAVVARRVLHALTADPEVVVRDADEAEALRRVSSSLEWWAGPLTARSPLASLTVIGRLQPPGGDDPVDPSVEVDDEAPWTVDLFVSSADDPSLFLSASSLWSDDVAVVPAERPRTPVMGPDPVQAQAALRHVRQRLLAASPTLARALDREQPSQAELSIDEVLAVVHEDFDDLRAAGLELQLPSWWTTPKRVRASGRATPTDAAVTSAGLNAKSLAAIDWSIVLGDDRLTEAELTALAEAKRDLVNVRGRWMTVDQRALSKALTAVMRLRDERSVVTGGELLTVAADVDADLVGESWTADLLAGLPDDRVEPIAEPLGFVGQLRPYQQRGVGWMAFLDRLGLGGVLADDMGLGKTAQLLALESHQRAASTSSKPTLVVCPLSVVHNWETEAARFTPSLRIGIHHGPDRKTGATLTEWAQGLDLVVTTFSTAARDGAALADVGWLRVVVDEAQHVKNHHTNAAKALRRLRAEQRLALTGTPVENRLADLWSIMDLVNPGLLGTADAFRHDVAIPIERHRDADVTRRLRTTISPFLLRRSKADKTLVPELPDKIESTAWATLTREQASLYRAVADQFLAKLPHLDGMDRRGAIVAAITKLKQICNHPAHYLGDGSRLDGRSGKLARFDELLDTAFESDEQVIAFTQYVEMGKLVQRHLASRLDLDVPFLSGSVPKPKRDAMVQRFQQGDTPLLLVSLKAGGSGLNLTAASQVIHIDRWWNPAVEDQASDRAWRIGQTSTVLVHKLASRGTIEERIDKLIAEKRELADRVVGQGDAGEGWMTELSTDQLRELIELGPVT
jgi:SNF2 family DNA or RNA helicase